MIELPAHEPDHHQPAPEYAQPELGADRHGEQGVLVAGARPRHCC